MSTQENEKEATSKKVSRRNFVAGGAVIGAAVMAGSNTVIAKETRNPGKFSTPDWRTLKPGAQDSDLYWEQSGYNDEDLTWWNGRNISGVAIGLIQFRANLPMMPGNMGNATTFDFPMLYREMNADNALDVCRRSPSSNSPMPPSRPRSGSSCRGSGPSWGTADSGAITRR